MQSSILPWISIISLMVYAPILSYLDWNYRDIGTHKLWLPLLALNIPVAVAGYLTGLYPPVMLFLTGILSLGWFMLLHHRGADCAWLICITMFAVLNPRTGTNFVQPFLTYLIIFTAATFWGIWLDNRFRKDINSFKMERGIPYLIVISMALIAAVVF
jgi:hypothetical protein